MSEDREDSDLLIALSEAVILLLDHAIHRPSVERHNKVRQALNMALQQALQRRTGRP